MAVAGSGHEQWSSRFGFLMATVGFAVGLGNIWRFPYVAGENGGAAFVLVYLACAFGIGVPIVMAELMIGRSGRMSPPESMRRLALAAKRSPAWRWVGGMGLLAAFTIVIVYAVIVGWVLWYLYKAVTTGFVGVDAQVANSNFTEILQDPLGMMAWTLLGLSFTGYIIYAGVQGGIEKAVKIMMPTLFGLLVLLAVYNVFAGGMREALVWLFTPDFSKLTPQVLLAAIGQAFFSIGVAMGGMMTFGAYLPKHVSIPRSVLMIVIADTLVAILAGLVIFPAVFANGLDPAAGPGLIFQTLPVAFAQMPGGYLFGVLFFLLISVAGITSMVGLVESITAWMEDYRGYDRHKSALLVVVVIAAISSISVLSYNVLSDFTIYGRDLNGVLDYFSNQILLPLGGLMIALFVGWFLSREMLTEELGFRSQRMFALWHFLLRYLVPPAVLIIFVRGIAW
ncbi:sodium-dependent transporter [Halieaceae bacterium IMCC14734]|uniref:Transporter n=1 Tax=Candidatus Litorirhabdus singularis TaxID=2518993 RepID=A0ABT3TFH0_9GAMM|nr:sodium-dependent transporter [Candidatus Litorirhabdus singularis]MCX2981057.1 sodium-dependent transporter [Candidatus Litorirhabdus singularis]